MNKLIFSAIFIISCLTNHAIAASKVSFWENNPQGGANIFSKQVLREDIRAAKSYGIKFIRLASDKFKTAKKDFLIGDADNYVALIPEDLAALKQVLDICKEEKMPVVLTMLSLPGSRWKQHNNNKDDLRIWSDAKFQQQAAQFWQDLAMELKDHPSIVGYNILNEPHPERVYEPLAIDITQVNQQEVQNRLFQFYDKVITAIIKVDPATPIILDSSAYANPQTFKNFKLHTKGNIIYSFHMYEPYEYTTCKINRGKLHYPGVVKGKYWDKQALRNYLENVSEFQKQHNIPNSRILVGEFGGDRTSKGLTQYFKDLTDVFIEKHWHFAFYAFREDVWNGMDYELGDKKLPWSYWQAIEKGQNPELSRKKDYPQFEVLLEAINKS